MERAREVAGALQEAGLLAPQDGVARLERLVAPPTLEEALEGTAYVAEAAPEDLVLKQDLFQRLDALAPPEAVLASNTSGYNPADLAAVTAHPERVLVAHYFGPAYLIPLVEVVPHPATAPWALRRTVDLLTRAGKRPVPLERFSPGFVANRLQQALFREALSLMREGIAPPDGDRRGGALQLRPPPGGPRAFRRRRLRRARRLRRPGPQRVAHPVYRVRRRGAPAGAGREPGRRAPGDEERGRVLRLAGRPPAAGHGPPRRRPARRLAPAAA